MFLIKKIFGGIATLVAQEIRSRIHQTLGIPVSAAVAPSKYLAKIASDWNKPNNIFVISPDIVTGFLCNLHVKKLPRVGLVMAKKLTCHGIYTCAHVQNYGLPSLVKVFGRFGSPLYKMSCGTHHSRVSTDAKRKSVSAERTFEKDIGGSDGLLPYFNDLILNLEKRFQNVNSNLTVKKCFVKVKFSDFSVVSILENIDHAGENVFHKFLALLNRAKARKLLPIRLIGVGYHLQKEEQQQLFLDYWVAK